MVEYSSTVYCRLLDEVCIIFERTFTFFVHDMDGSNYFIQFGA
jgi:hypothetical protein